jgi:indole-3-glycerol phosphate synthase
MNDRDGLAPAVQEILAAARSRSTPAQRLSVDARSLTDAIAQTNEAGKTPVIAEIKPTSPTTQGRSEADPVALAEAMVAGGAAAISVLTEPTHFGGSTDTLRRVRAAVDVPVLRKDFILEPTALDAVAADAVLLIARFVEDLESLIRAAVERGFQPLVEVHTQSELREAVDAGATLVGINNRDLSRLEVDLGTFERVAPAAPDGLPLVAESGIRTPEDARRMRTAGADALLVGSALMQGDPAEKTRGLVDAHRGDDGR